MDPAHAVRVAYTTHAIGPIIVPAHTHTHTHTYYIYIGIKINKQVIRKRVE